MAIAYTATVNGYDYGFDWYNQFIYVDSTLDDIQIEELYDAIKEAQASEPGMVEEVIASASGLDELDDGVQTFITMRLFDEWEIRSQKTSGKVTTQGGNVVKDNGKDPFFDDGSIFYVAFFSQAGVKTTVAVGSGVTAQDKTDIVNQIFAELTDGSETFKESMRLIRAAAAGESTDDGAGNAALRDVADTKDRITTTYDPITGARLTVAVDVS